MSALVSGADESVGGVLLESPAVIAFDGRDGDGASGSGPAKADRRLGLIGGRSSMLWCGTFFSLIAVIRFVRSATSAS